MKREIKDYLHLYLGCWVQLSNDHVYLLVSQSVRHDSEIGLKTALELSAKPILHPLSSIRYDEAICLDGGFIEVSHTDNTVYQPVYYSPNKSKMSAEDILFLISKHFDLFNLIPDGLAIDATTITQPAT